MSYLISLYSSFVRTLIKKRKSSLSSIAKKESYLNLLIWTGFIVVSPILVGIIILSIFYISSPYMIQPRSLYNSGPIYDPIATTLAFMEGGIGALIMLASGLQAIILACLKKWKSSFYFLLLAISWFLLRGYLLPKMFEICTR